MVTILYRLVSARSISTTHGFPFHICQSFPSYALSGQFQLIYGDLASTKLSVILATAFKHHILFFIM